MRDRNGRFGEFYVEKVVLDGNRIRLSLEGNITIDLPRNMTELPLAANLEGGRVRIFTDRCHKISQNSAISLGGVVSVESGDKVVYSAEEDPYRH